MPIFYGKVALIESLKSIKTPNSTIGFCTLRWALHQGHLSLMQQSLVENDSTVVSIFILHSV
jgi:pantoate--beta-alanine ligase